MDDLRNKVERLIGTAILKNDKNYTDEMMELISTHSLQERKKAAVRGYGCDNDEDFRELIKQLEATKEAL